MAGGFAAISNPLTPLGLTTEVLQNGPFTTFLIPGLFLFLIIGVANFICGIVSIKNEKLSPFTSFFLGGILCTWIVVQCIILMAVAALHIIFFLIGGVQMVLGVKEVWKWGIGIFQKSH
jgi:hypothetical protein